MTSANDQHAALLTGMIAGAVGRGTVCLPTCAVAVGSDHSATLVARHTLASAAINMRVVDSGQPYWLLHGHLSVVAESAASIVRKYMASADAPASVTARTWHVPLEGTGLICLVHEIDVLVGPAKAIDRALVRICESQPPAPAPEASSVCVYFC
eukprot:Opistho-2@37195